MLSKFGGPRIESRGFKKGVYSTRTPHSGVLATDGAPAHLQYQKKLVSTSLKTQNLKHRKSMFATSDNIDFFIMIRQKWRKTTTTSASC
jgi:hypothetical protein